MKPDSQSKSAARVTDDAVNQRAAEWLMRREAGLDGTSARELQAWLDAEPRNRAAFERLERTWVAFDPARSGNLGDVIVTGLAQRAKARARRRTRVALATAVCVLLVCGVLWWRAALGQRDGRMQIAAEPVRKLPDGSIVELNAGAEIAVEFEAALRRVRLVRGEVHFRVEKDALRPFVVEAGTVRVRAVGTAFTVQLQPQKVEVVVAEGRVAVNRETGGAGGEPAKPTYLEALNSLVMDLAARAPEAPAVMTLTEPQLDERLAWRIPRLQFSGTELGEAVALMNRHNRLQIRLDGGEIARLRIGGVFRSDNPEGFVRMMEGTFGLRAEIAGENEIVLRRR